jgi:hypothetical protein
MAAIGNMGPFSPVTVKGGARSNAVPVFMDKLPVTLGGIASADAYFGRVVSRTGSSHVFQKGIPAGSSPCGILIYDPTIAYADPAMPDKYYEGRPATVVTHGLIELMDYDMSYEAPTFGSKTIANDADGRIAFIAASTAVPTGWTQLNAFVYDTEEPNGVKLWIQLPIVTPTFAALDMVETPVADPAAGAVAAGTVVKLTSATPGAEIRYTLDNSVPTFSSPKFPAEGIAITVAGTITAIATKEGMNPSAVLTAAYTIA